MAKNGGAKHSDGKVRQGHGKATHGKGNAKWSDAMVTLDCVS